MTLKRRLSAQIAGIMVGITMLGIASIAGVSSLHTDLSVALRANEQLRHTYTIGVRVAAARSLAEQPGVSRQQLASSIDEAANLFDTYGRTPVDQWVDGTAIPADQLSQALHESARQFGATSPREDVTAIDAVTGFAAPYRRFADLIHATQQTIAQQQALADQKQRWTLACSTTLALLVIASSGWFAIRQYRSVMRPLLAIRSSARRIASGHFDERATPKGDEEFASLATDFNAMAAELQSMYADLEQRIAVKSRELASSERLASVGFLAAGVAHEINNPLAIIAGHGERSLMRLERDDIPTDVELLHNSFRIICDEVFRCKRITDSLLVLARPGSETREPVLLDRIVREVVATLSALPRFRDRRVTLRADNSTEWIVVGSEQRLRQVILNLVVNAFEATPSGTGHLSILLQRPREFVELRLVDNGKGITADALDRIFEPFYSEKRDASAGAVEHAGTGLGLSIAHSIVTGLGGTIRAESGGLGCGSTFILTLPAPLLGESGDAKIIDRHGHGFE